MKLTPFALLPDVILVENPLFNDHRGTFFESYRENLIGELGIDDFVQGNFSLSHERVLRGLHYQTRKPQGKLMRTVSGATFNVAVDLREGSSTFGQHVSTVLNHPGMALWVPPGFANGFLALRSETAVYYECSAYYQAGYDSGVHPFDPALGIKWPVLPEICILSDKDQRLPMLADAARVAAEEVA